MKTILLSNMKGGVGKTTTANNLAGGLATKGFKVLLVDLDPQANTTDYYFEENADLIYLDEMLLDMSKARYYQTEIEGLCLIPSRLELATTEKAILLDSAKANHNRLRKILHQFKGIFDYVIIDCPPILNVLIVNALNVADEVLIPYKIDKGSRKGYEMTLDNVREVAESYDLDLDYKILFTAVQRNNTDKKEINKIREIEGDKVLKHTVRNQAKPVTQASFDKKLVINTNTGVGDDYKNVVNELVERWQK